MLSKIELDKSIDKKEYKAKIKELSLKLGGLQRKAKAAKLPIMLVFEGWDAAGKGTLINKVLQCLDPRGVNVYPTKVPTENERFHPFLWRFWKKTPVGGKIVFYDRSWYRRVTVDRLENNFEKCTVNNDFEDIINFERQITDGGCMILKFFLHISKKEQISRFRKLQGDPTTEWRVTTEDLNNHERYNDYLNLYEDMIERTNTDNAPWIVVESNNNRYATLKIFQSIITAIEDNLNRTSKTNAVAKRFENDFKEAALTSEGNRYLLDEVDLSLKLSNVEYKCLLKKHQNRLRELEHEIYKKRISVIAVYEGWDAAGKGGNIKRLVENLDPRGYEVIPIAAPNDDEKAHNYLWRFWRDMPKDGHIAIFDRSWYGRVLVERVEGFCSDIEWKRAYKEINEMELHLARHGVIIAKFWLHIDKEEQLRRFEDRRNTPEKNWKITEEDWRNREKWEDYSEAVNDMLIRTSTPYAPWTVVESNDKLYGRIKVYETLIKLIEERL